MKNIVSCVDYFSELSGRWVSLLILPLVFVVMYEVVMRKVLHMPTSWAFEMTIYLYGAHFMLGMAYTMYHDRHVRIDVIVLQLPERIQLWLRVITFLIIFVPFLGVLTYAAVGYAAKSWMHWEHSWSAWKPPLYPYKTIMPLGFAMLFVQGIATFVRDIYKLKGEKI
jgi:TRAP-type mannitol/chloroaromatic compound transport system permease small subunit